MMKTTLLFPTPLWEIPNVGVEKQPLLDFVDYVRDEDPNGRVSSNEGGWQSNNFTPPYIDKTPLKELHKQIELNTYTAGDEYGFNDYTIKLINLWSNINTKGHSNAIHTHSGSMFAGVYYAQVPNCCSGELKFHRPLHEQCLKEYWGCDENFDRYEKQHNFTEWYVQPKPWYYGDISIMVDAQCRQE